MSEGQRHIIGCICENHSAQVLAELGYPGIRPVATLFMVAFFEEIDMEQFGNDLECLTRELAGKAAGCPLCYLGATGTAILNWAVKEVKSCA